MALEHDCMEIACESCRAVVTQAYNGLRTVGRNDRSAFNAAVRVLTLRSPGRAQGDYKQTVAMWLLGEPNAHELSEQVSLGR